MLRFARILGACAGRLRTGTHKIGRKAPFRFAGAFPLTRRKGKTPFRARLFSARFLGLPTPGAPCRLVCGFAFRPFAPALSRSARFLFLGFCLFCPRGRFVLAARGRRLCLASPSARSWLRLRRARCFCCPAQIWAWFFASRILKVEIEGKYFLSIYLR